MQQSYFKDKQIPSAFVLTVGFIAFLVVTFVLSWKLCEKRYEHDVSDIGVTEFPMTEFPVIVFTPGKSKLIFLGELEKYKRENPNYTFLIPDGNEDLINSQLLEDQKARGGKGTPRISAKPISDGKQLIEFEIMGDGFFLSRYQAGDKEVKPLMIKSAGVGFVFLPFYSTLVIGLTGFLFLQIILYQLRRRQNIKMI